jgi:hypothetical protein
MISAREVLDQMPAAQKLTLAQLTQQHPESRWHMADCGCCVCFHPDSDVTRGWLIGSDGKADYHAGHDDGMDE